MKRIFYYTITLVLVLSIFSCRRDKEDDDDNTQDTTRLSSILPADWQAEIVDSVSTEITTAKIAIDKYNGVHILYLAGNDKYDLKYAYKSVAGTWTTQTVYSQVSSSRFDIAVSSSNVYTILLMTTTTRKCTYRKKGIDANTWTDKILSDSHLTRYPAYL